MVCLVAPATGERFVKSSSAPQGCFGVIDRSLAADFDRQALAGCSDGGSRCGN
jgi:hypothetical protein